MKFRIYRSRFAFGVPAVVAAGFLIGCGAQPVEESAVFKDQEKVVRRVDEDVKALSRQIEDITLSMAALKQDMREVRNAPQEVQFDTSGLTQRIDAIEAAVKELPTRMTSLEKSMNTRISEAKDIAKATATRVVESASAAAPEAASSAPKGTIVRTSSPAAPAPAPASAARKGFYYSVQPGDTAEKIAGEHKISVARLLESNRIPSGGMLIAGRQIYVPAK